MGVNFRLRPPPRTKPLITGTLRGNLNFRYESAVSPPVESTGNWNARKSAPGIEMIVPLEDPGPADANLVGRWGDFRGIMNTATNSGQLPFIDTNHKFPGTNGSLCLRTPTGSHENGGGDWFTGLGDSYATQKKILPGNGRHYMQFLMEVDDAQYNNLYRMRDGSQSAVKMWNWNAANRFSPTFRLYASDELGKMPEQTRYNRRIFYCYHLGWNFATGQFAPNEPLEVGLDGGADINFQPGNVGLCRYSANAQREAAGDYNFPFPNCYGWIPNVPMCIQIEVEIFNDQQPNGSWPMYMKKTVQYGPDDEEHVYFEYTFLQFLDDNNWGQFMFWEYATQRDPTILLPPGHTWFGQLLYGRARIPKFESAPVVPPQPGSRPAYMNGMVKDQWNEIPNSKMSQFRLNASWDVNRNSSWTWESLEAFGGWAFDEVLCRFVLMETGGHFVSIQANGVYDFEVLAEVPAWRVVKESTNWVAYDGRNYQQSPFWPNGETMPPHVYDYVFVITPSDGSQKYMFLPFLSAVTYLGHFQPWPQHLKLRADGTSQGWNLFSQGEQHYPGHAIYGNPGPMAKDPRNQRLYTIDNAGMTWYRDPGMGKQWQPLLYLPGGWPFSDSAMDIDLDRNEMVVSWDPNAGANKPSFKKINLTTLVQTSLKITGPGAAHVWEDTYPALEHVPSRNKYYLLTRPPFGSGVARLITVDCDTGLAQHIADAPITWDSVCKGKMKYVPQTNALYYTPGFDRNMLCMPLS